MDLSIAGQYVYIYIYIYTHTLGKSVIYACIYKRNMHLSYTYIYEVHFVARVDARGGGSQKGRFDKRIYGRRHTYTHTPS